jgi:hypothetical protein
MFFWLVAKKDILELVHSCIGEHEGGVIFNDHWCGGNYMMVLFPEKIKKGLPDFF